jgi:HSP20 family molecular chaperone IbpA
MTDPHGIAAAGSFIAGAWRTETLAAIAIFVCFLALVILPKAILVWFERRSSGLVGTRWGEIQTAKAPPNDKIEARSEVAPEPGPPLEAAPEPAEPEAIISASVSAADPAPDSAGASIADPQLAAGRSCRMDVAATADGLQFVIEAPGMDESDFEIRVVGETILVRGRLDPDRSNKVYRAVERDHGPFSRSIPIAQGVPIHRIQASLSRGLLTIFVPNPTVQVGSTITVNSALCRITDSESMCELKIDLPGVDPSDIDLDIRNGLLTISCRESLETGPTGLPQSMLLPAGVDASRIGAVLAKGVLSVTLPIAPAHRQRTIVLETVGEPA